MKFLAVVAVTIAAVTAENIICTPGYVFKMDCNICTCSPDGLTVACTDMACPKVAPKSKVICEPRSQFKNYCNTCFCAEDGLSASCTRMICDKEIWNLDGTLKVVPESNPLLRSRRQVCSPGTKFNDYCNTCKCSEDGLFFDCSRMECDERIYNQDGTRKLVNKQNTLLRSAVNQVCEPHKLFKNYCNNCFCSDDGSTFACTRMMCDKEIWNQDGTLKVTPESNRVTRSAPKQICEPRTQFKNYCNNCFCSEDGSTYSCTRMMCDNEIWNQDGSLKIVPESRRVTRSADAREFHVDDVCVPNSQFKENCNNCTCSNDGISRVCTTMKCDEEKVIEEEPKQICEPSTLYSRDGCNTCICSEDGTRSACTYKLCFSPLQRAFELEGSRKWGPLYKQGDSCAPGKAFYSECNRCVCTLKGNSAYCTYLKCPMSSST